eukprot:3586843-Rhodomonas_salina.10
MRAYAGSRVTSNARSCTKLGGIFWILLLEIRKTLSFVTPEIAFNGQGSSGCYSSGLAREAYGTWQVFADVGELVVTGSIASSRSATGTGYRARCKVRVTSGQDTATTDAGLWVPRQSAAYVSTERRMNKGTKQEEKCYLDIVARNPQVRDLEAHVLLLLNQVAAVPEAHNCREDREVVVVQPQVIQRQELRRGIWHFRKLVATAQQSDQVGHLANDVDKARDSIRRQVQHDQMVPGMSVLDGRWQFLKVLAANSHLEKIDCAH